MKVIDRILKHPLVESISDERDYLRTPPGCDQNGDGFWVYLKKGYIDDMNGIHCLHENSPSECLALLKCVVPCKPGCECDFDKPR